jgi:hypothetical protein
MWRIRNPKNDLFGLALILFSVPIFIVILYIKMENIYIFNRLSVSGLFAIFILYFSLAFGYIMSYPAIQAISPSLEILMLIGRAKNRMMTKEDIIKNINNKLILTNRLLDLKRCKLVKQKEKYYELTLIAKIIMLIFNYYRKLIGLSEGKG